MSKKLKPPIVIFICIAILIASKFLCDKAFFAGAAESDKISGWGWSENIGWVSFNCTNVGCSGTNYGVNLNFDTSYFTGYAWSENVGWIDFAPLSGFPAAPAHAAKYDSATSKVTGWARAKICETSDCGGWDGWIKLGDDSGPTWTNQVTINREIKEFQGWAWGGDVIGWISFNCSTDGSCQ